MLIEATAWIYKLQMSMGDYFADARTESVRPVGPVDTCWCVNCNNLVRKLRAYVANVHINFALISPISNTYHYQHNNVMNYQRHWPALSMNTFQWNTGKNWLTKVVRYYLWTSVGSEQLSPAAVLTLTMINKARSHLADTVCIFYINS